MRRYLVVNPQHKNGKHDYSLAQFGMDSKDIGRLFQSYRDQFLAEREAA